jgi:hypothetical protein
VRRDIFWSAEPCDGFEHLSVAADGSGVVLDGLVVAEMAGRPLRLAYRIVCAPDWCVRSLAIRHLDGDGRLALQSDGRGSWQADDGHPVPELAGAIDVDIRATPTTNTLPIRRLRLAPGESGEIRVAYIDVPDLAARPVTQRYTRLEDARGGARYRYESATFRTDLEVDDEGFVIDYPAYWTRRGSTRPPAAEGAP